MMTGTLFGYPVVEQAESEDSEDSTITLSDMGAYTVPLKVKLERANAGDDVPAFRLARTEGYPDWVYDAVFDAIADG